LLRAALIGLVGLLAACGRGAPEMTLCNSQGLQCREFRTKEQFVRWSQYDDARRRNLALHLPVDYREIVLVTLQKYLGDFRNPNVEYHFFMSVFGEDPDPELSQRFMGSGLHLGPGSQCDVHERAQRAMALGDDSISLCLDVSEISSVDATTYRVHIDQIESTCTFGHCTGGVQVDLKRVGNSWQLVNFRTAGSV
jgi:hypothetical protein